MSLAIAHFAMGVSITCAVLLATGKYHKPYALLFTYAGGIFAMMPDLWRFVPGLTRSHHASLWANLFVGHQYVDQLDPGDSHQFAVLLVVVMGVVICLVTGYRYRNSIETPSDTSIAVPSDE